MVDREVDPRLEAIKAAVSTFRAEKKITPTPGDKREGSCIGQGEARNLFGQLAHTTEGSGSWAELGSTEVVDMLLEWLQR